MCAPEVELGSTQRCPCAMGYTTGVGLLPSTVCVSVGITQTQVGATTLPAWVERHSSDWLLSASHSFCLPSCRRTHRQGSSVPGSMQGGECLGHNCTPWWVGQRIPKMHRELLRRPHTGVQVGGVTTQKQHTTTRLTDHSHLCQQPRPQMTEKQSGDHCSSAR